MTIVKLATIFYRGNSLVFLLLCICIGEKNYDAKETAAFVTPNYLHSIYSSKASILGTLLGFFFVHGRPGW